MQVTARIMLHTTIDEGDFVSILSSNSWQAIGSPKLVPASDQILDFNRRPIAPLGILPHFPITLGRKIVCIDVMVVQGPLDFNMLLGRYYIYVMKAVVSTLFQGINFPHVGNIVMVYQLSFVKPNHRMIPSH